MSELAALVRFVHLTAAIVLAGGFGFRLFVARPAFASAKDASATLEHFIQRSQLRNFRWCVAVLSVTMLLGLWLQAANVSGSSLPTLSALFPLVTETQFGRVWLIRMALLIVIAVLVKRKPTANEPANLLALGFTLSGCLLAGLAFAGHAAAADGAEFVLQVSADALHLLASGVWLGGLVPWSYLLRECNRNGDATHFAVAREATRRFSNLALASVIVLICTGLYNTWNLVGGFAPLFGTTYGKLLLVKLGLLLPLLAIGAVNLIAAQTDNRRIERPRRSNHRRATKPEPQRHHRSFARPCHFADRRPHGRHAAGAPCSTRLALVISLGLDGS